MSLITNSALVGSIRGGVGSTVFREGANGQTAQLVRTRTKTQGGARQQRAFNVVTYAAQWNDLSEADREEWNNAPCPGRNGRERYIGYQLRLTPYFITPAFFVQPPHGESPTSQIMLEDDGAYMNLLGFDPPLADDGATFYQQFEPVPLTKRSSQGAVELGAFWGSEVMSENYFVKCFNADNTTPQMLVDCEDYAGIWTVEGWVNFDAFDPVFHTTLFTTRDFQFGAMPTTGEVLCVTSSGFIFWAGVAFSTGGWHHYAVQVDPGTGEVTLWLDGVNKGVGSTLNAKPISDGFGLFNVAIVTGGTAAAWIGPTQCRLDGWDDVKEGNAWNAGASGPFVLTATSLWCVTGLRWPDGSTQRWGAGECSIRDFAVRTGAQGLVSIPLFQFSDYRLAQGIFRMKAWRWNFGFYPSKTTTTEIVHT